MDNIIIYSKSHKEHQEHVCKVLLALREAGLQADINKYKFLVPETQFLEVIVSDYKIWIDLCKVQAIVE